MKVYITNLGKYNEGKLIGKWIEMPMDEDDFLEALESIGVSDEMADNGQYYEEWFITDYEDTCGVEIEEYTSYDELEELAERLDDILRHTDEEVVELIIENEGEDCALNILEYENFIVHTCENIEQLAEELLDERLREEGVPDWIYSYIDYEQYARDLHIEGTFYEGSNFVVEVF